MPVDSGDGAAMVTAMAAEMRELYWDVGALPGGLDLDAPDMPTAGPAELGPPFGTFLVGYTAEGAAVCGGGLKRLPDGACGSRRIDERASGARRPRTGGGPGVAGCAGRTRAAAR